LIECPLTTQSGHKIIMQFHTKAKIILSLLALILILIVAYYAFLGNAFYKSLAGNEEDVSKLTLYISSSQYRLEQIVSSLDKLKDSHNLERRHLNSENHTRYDAYETAIWYSLPRTEYWGFGVALVTWSKLSKEEDDRYIIDVYSKDSPCKLCDDTTKLLENSDIEYSTE